MSSHTGRVFLNSCLKTPIDPCNNCPAPIYNRPKMYLGRLSTVTPLATSKSTLVKNTDITESTEGTQLWASTGIRSLAKFYDSIPDYCDINHLTEEEFYSTLDSLRTTCRELKTKPFKNCFLDDSSLNSTLTTNSNTTKQKKSCKTKKSSNKKSNCKKKSKSLRKEKNETVEKYANLHSITPTPCGRSASDTFGEVVYKSCKNDFQAEVEAFKQTLKDFEDEIVNKSCTNTFKRAKSTNFLTRAESPKRKIDENTQTDMHDKPCKPNTVCRLKNMRKAFSFNDINSLSDTSAVQIEIDKPKFSKPDFKDNKRLSNYFAVHQKSESSATNELPKITIQSPNGETTISATTTERSAEKFKKQKQKQIKIPFSIFNLTSGNSKKENSPSPAHPVARPNLAATLRAEVSRKKLKELQNNCTFYDSTPQVDWEVRKTPAWRSLALNESHKQILALRLATRKAEQALQQREYELNMELMRQRVKSAPLLLEGETFWGPNVGKLTHNCPNEGFKHACENVLRKKKQRQRCTKTHSEIDVDTNIKLQELCKIYACSTKSSSQSRNSQHSTGRRSSKARRKEKKCLLELNATIPSTVNDSGDELSSADRAFL